MDELKDELQVIIVKKDSADIKTVSDQMPQNQDALVPHLNAVAVELDHNLVD